MILRSFYNGKYLETFKTHLEMNNEILNNELNKAAKKAGKDKSFIRRNFWVWVLVAYFIYPTATIFSAITEGGHIYSRAFETFAHSTAAWLITIVLVVILESSKYLLKFAVDDLQANVFTKGGAELFAFFVKAIWGLLALGISIFLSISGASKISGDWRKADQSNVVATVSLDSINTKYDARIAPYQAQVNSLRRNTWEGVMNPVSVRSMDRVNKIIEGIESERSQEIAKANSENTALIEEYKGATIDNQSYAQGFAGISEAIILLCIIFIGVYDDGIKKEAKGLGINAPF